MTPKEKAEELIYEFIEKDLVKTVPGLNMYVVSGRNYRCVREPRSNLDFGRWEFEYKGNWYEVVNFGIRKELNKFAGYYAR